MDVEYHCRAWFLTGFLVCCFFFSVQLQAEGRRSSSGFLDFNVYPYLSDVSNDNTLTINAFAKLDNRFSYFSLTNFGNQANETELSELDTYYTEQNIRWMIAEGSPFDLTAQFNFRTGERNDRHRLGVRWRFHDSSSLEQFFKAINMKYSINLHAIQFDREDGYIWQMEHVFNMRFPFISEKLYLSGFIDHTFNQRLPSGYPSNPIVGEFQLGYRVVDQFYLITEYRINEYRRSDVNNLAAGFEYKIIW